MRRWLTLLLLTGLQAGTASAAEMRSLEVDYDEGRYTLVSVAWFDADLDAVYAVFSRWDLSEQFSSAIVDARDIDPDESGRPGFYVVNRGCVLFFCKSLTRQGYVERETNVVLKAYADPAYSDFKISDETWHFVEKDGGTVVTYRLFMQPDFWVPPAIGPYILKRKLKSDGTSALHRIEALAQKRGSAARIGGVVID